MGAWPDLATAISDLRTFLSDGPTDRPVKQKKLVGECDGTNTEFFAWEERVVPGSLVVNVDFTPVAATLTDPVMGLITLASPPAGGSTVRARYYYQYFLDAELQLALMDAATQIQGSDDVTTIESAMKIVVLNFGGYFGYKKQAIRWAQRMSDKWILKESPEEGDNLSKSNLFDKLARTFMDEARILRDDFYKRQSRQLAPAAAMMKPRIPRVGPRF